MRDFSAIAEMFSRLQIVQVVLMGIGLFLKADMVIGFQAIAVFDIEHQPLYAIPNEEGQVEQLFLLGGMDALVVQLGSSQRSDGKNEAK